MTLGERVKEIRKVKGLTQQEFGNLIGIKRNSVALIEGGRGTSDQTIHSICRVFNVREEWLRNGEGAMFLQEEPDELDELLKSRGISQGDLPSIKSVVTAFLELDKPSRDAVIQFVKTCAEKLNAPIPAAIPASIPATSTAPEGDLAAKVDALEQQNRELIARLEAIEKEDAEWEAERMAQSVSRSPFP